MYRFTPWLKPAAAATLIGLICSATLWAQDAPQITNSTADHSKFEALQQAFASGPEVTAACLSCHTEAATQVKHSVHWTWEFDNSATGQRLGKRHVLNSFCGSVASNEPRCTSCHVGYGWEDMNKPPPADDAAVDCLVCHDTSGQYTKLDNAAGHAVISGTGTSTGKAKTITGAKAWAVDLTKAAQSVGKPSRQNCGNCHFYGGGGDNVKHGDLSSALNHPSRDVDVHMADDGLNFSCETCHRSDKHVFAGSRYAVHATDPEGAGKPGLPRRDVATCESCHGDTPHDWMTVQGIKLNDHSDRVACQTCHIPEFARGGVATKTRWDWSTAGRMDVYGNPLHLEEYTQGDGKHLHTYLATKGDFEYGEDVVPHYAWFNGQVEYTTADATIDPTQVVEINQLAGSSDDGRSRIWPFKRMEGRQAYDANLNHLAYSNVWGPTTDSAFWTHYDWGKAIEAGMKAAGADYSGEYGFVDTYMYWPITHMVAPAEDALDCQDCHTSNGRLAKVSGIYMPGSQPFSIGGILGILVFIAMVSGVLLHITLRIITRGAKGDDHD
ncbi:tetrathionate reductase family octaheme c-type cytochrome [Thiohalocapsa marina]|uniref:tetrathionate reductase family octaheme c-type cytochrome n=1 Tax=Thiohalocapsa marina TaxID=424902 RepID=UPI0036DA7B52